MEYSLPPYFFGLLPLMVYVIALWLGPILAAQTISRVKVLGGIAMGSVCLQWLLGDVFYQIEQPLKWALITGERFIPMTAIIAGKILLPLGLSFGIGWGLKRKAQGWGATALPLTLCAGLLGNHLAWDGLQAHARYNTSTAYGVVGTEATVHFLNQLGLRSTRRVLMTRDLIYATDLPERDFYPFNDGCWFDPQQFLHALTNADVAVYALGLQGLHQYRDVFQHPAVRKALTTEFIHHPIGSYDIWTRKGMIIPPLK
jgi:hypothetical protein